MLSGSEFLVEVGEEVEVEDEPVGEDEHRGVEGAPDDGGGEELVDAEPRSDWGRDEHQQDPEDDYEDIEHHVAGFGEPAV